MKKDKIKVWACLLMSFMFLHLGCGHKSSIEGVDSPPKKEEASPTAEPEKKKQQEKPQTHKPVPLPDPSGHTEKRGHQVRAEFLEKWRQLLDPSKESVKKPQFGVQNGDKIETIKLAQLTADVSVQKSSGLTPKEIAEFSNSSGPLASIIKDHDYLRLSSENLSCWARGASLVVLAHVSQMSDTSFSEVIGRLRSAHESMDPEYRADFISKTKDLTEDVIAILTLFRDMKADQRLAFLHRKHDDISVADHLVRYVRYFSSVKALENLKKANLDTVEELVKEAKNLSSNGGEGSTDHLQYLLAFLDMDFIVIETDFTARLYDLKSKQLVPIDPDKFTESRSVVIYGQQVHFNALISKDIFE